MDVLQKRSPRIGPALAQMHQAPEQYLLKTGILLLVFSAFSYELIRTFSRNAVYLILVALGTGCVCLGALLSKQKNRHAGRFAAALLLLALCSLIRNADLRNGIYDSEFIFLSYLFAAAALAFADHWQSFLRKAIVVCSFVHILCTLALFLFPDLTDWLIPMWLKWRLVPTGTNDGTAAYRGGITTHYSQNATYILFAVLILGSELLGKRGRNVHPGKWVCFAAAFLALVLTTKRAHLLFAVVTLFALYFLGAPKPFWQKVRLLLWAFCAGGVGVLLFSIAAPEAFQSLFGRFLNSGHGDITSGRMTLWALAMEEFRKSPVFGIGWGGYKYVYRSTLWNGQYAFPLMNVHNVYLQVLCELGIAGMGVYALILLWLLAQLWKRFRDSLADPDFRDTAYTAMGFFLFYLLYSCTGCCLYDFTFHLLILLFSGAVSLPARDAAV